MSPQSNRPVDWETMIVESENHLYRAALAILGSRQEAEDAVQDTFLRYLEKAPSNLQNTSAWLMRVLVNRCRDLMRDPRRTGALPLWDDLPTPGPEEREELEELYSLSPQDRAVIHLYYYEGWSTSEIARILGTRDGTVRSRLSRARSRLKTLLNDDNRDNN